MQSMIFPGLRKRFPNSKITYAIPKNFISLFDNCSDIDEVIDSSTIDSNLPKMVVTHKYDFFGEISTSCIEYESRVLKEKGYVDKSRQEIWSESMGLHLMEFRTCIKIDKELPDDIKQLKKKGNPIICIAPVSNEKTRSYPVELTNQLIELLKDNYEVIYMDSKKSGNIKNAMQLCDLDLKTMGRIINHIDLMISVDTGPLHYAGILGKPVIGLFGVTDAKVRVKHYNAHYLQGECQKGKEPCWYAGSAQCKKPKSDSASCMFINPEKIVDTVENIFNNTTQPVIRNKKRNIGIVIPIYIKDQFRLDYLRQTLESLRNSIFPEDCNFTLLLIDDCSDNYDEFDKFTIEGIEVIRMRNDRNIKVWGCLKKGFDYFYANNYDLMLNLDSDAIVKKDWLLKLLELHDKFPNTIISGFNAHSHKVISQSNGYYLKNTIGGINLLFKWEHYLEYIRKSFDKGNDWDWTICETINKLGKQFIVTNPSVIQHIGKETSLGHHHQHPDYAEDFNEDRNNQSI